jgi:hypothetical protein
VAYCPWLVTREIVDGQAKTLGCMVLLHLSRNRGMSYDHDVMAQHDLFS